MDMQPVKQDDSSKPNYPARKKWYALGLSLLVVGLLGLILLWRYGRILIEELRIHTMGILP